MIIKCSHQFLTHFGLLQVKVVTTNNHFNMKILPKYLVSFGALTIPLTFVLSTSPRREMVNDFKKNLAPLVFYMPLWTETELEIISPCFNTPACPEKLQPTNQESYLKQHVNNVT